MPPLSLQDAFLAVDDPRRRHGRQYPLHAVLNLLALAALLGRPSLAGASRLVEQYGGGLAIALGFRHYRAPRTSTLSILLRRLDAAQVEAAVRRWVEAQLAAEGRSVDVLAIDGKTLRGSRDGEIPGVHLLAADAGQADAVLAQVRVDAKTNEHKAALEMLGLLPADLRGTIVTGDAVFRQRDLCRAVRDRGGHYLFTVKENQKNLRMDVAAGLTF
ncbi:MAG: ISAs1 family transposase, partial [Planctomycetia bacterium]